MDETDLSPATTESPAPDAERLSTEDSAASSCPSPAADSSHDTARQERNDAIHDERTCHMLPCSIDFQGMASTHVYFRPVEHEGVVSSTFRGRGLLALAPEGLNDDKDEQRYLSAALLSVQGTQLQIKAEIDHILEWQHEHNPETLFLDWADEQTMINKSRVLVAQEWSEVALAVSHFCGQRKRLMLLLQCTGNLQISFIVLQC